jgi:hypothetical protein
MEAKSLTKKRTKRKIETRTKNTMNIRRSDTMKQLLAVLIILTISLSSSSCGLALFTDGPDLGPMDPKGILEKGTKVLVSNQFILNRGQLADDDIIFHSANAQFTSKGVRIRTTAPSSDGPQASNPGQLPQQAKRSFPIAYETDVFEVEFVGANDMIPVGKEQLPYPTNFFVGNDASRWVSGVPSYRSIFYEDLYDGIDLLYTTAPEGIKYEFIVRPGAEDTNIRLAYHGAEVSTDGQALLISTPHTTVIDGGLMAYETSDQYGPISSRTTVDVSIVLTDNTVAYKVLGHDPSKVLVIDPLIFSTFLGASSNEEPSNVALDPSGNLVVAGTTSSLDFPTRGTSSCPR